MPDTSGRAWPVRNLDRGTGGAERLDVLWPIWHQLTGPGRDETRIRPLYREIQAGDRKLVEFAWPIFTRRTEPGRESLLVLPIFYRRRLFDDAGWDDRDWALLPFVFSGSDPKEGDYLLFFPVWGNTRGLLGKDEMTFRLFPLYLGAKEGEYESAHLLWPFVSWGEGGGRRDFRILPFYAHREKDGKSRSTSVLWPLVSWGEEGLDTEHPAESLLVFPFYGEVESDAAWSRIVGFPIYMASGAEGGYLDLNVLWPVFRSRTGPDGPRSLRVWPLFSTTREKTEDGERREDFYLWPLIWDSETMTGEGGLSSFQVVPFVRSAIRTDAEGRERGSEFQLWPLFRRRKAADGSVHLQALAPIPLVDLESFEAAWGFSWTILDHVSAPGGSSTDALFGLFQHRSSEEGTYTGAPLLLEYVRRKEDAKVHLLKGLLGYESSPESDAIRLFWFLRIGL